MTISLAAVYCRVSTGTQKNSLEGQDRRCLDYALAKGLVTPECLIFADEQVSGRKPIRERPDGAKLMHALQHGVPYNPSSTAGINSALMSPVQHLIVAKIDRLGRKAGDLLGVWDFCKEQGITLHIVDLCGDSITSGSSIGRIIYGMLALFAEFEREMIVERVQQTIDQLFDQGRVAGTIPYGFDEALQGAERHLVPNPTEQSWLLQMARWRWRDPVGEMKTPGSNTALMAYNQIAKQLNVHLVPTKTGKLGRWQSGNVAKILNSRTTREFLLNQVTQKTL